MSISKWIKALYQAGDTTAQHHLNYQALAHLDDHLLRDIGLYVDHGEVRPLTGMPSHDIERIGNRYCPYCGRILT